MSKEALVLSSEWENGFLGLQKGTLRDYHRDPLPHSLLRTRANGPDRSFRMRSESPSSCMEAGHGVYKPYPNPKLVNP